MRGYAIIMLSERRHSQISIQIRICGIRIQDIAGGALFAIFAGLHVQHVGICAGLHLHCLHELICFRVADNDEPLCDSTMLHSQFSVHIEVTDTAFVECVIVCAGQTTVVRNNEIHQISTADSIHSFGLQAAHVGTTDTGFQTFIVTATASAESLIDMKCHYIGFCIKCLNIVRNSGSITGFTSAKIEIYNIFHTQTPRSLILRRL